MRVLLLALLTAALSFAADVTGKWTGELPMQNGNVPVTMTLKADGESLTGTISTQMGDQQIKEGKIKGDELTWYTTLERDGNTMKINNKAKVTGAEMKVTITVEGRDFTLEYTAKKS